MSQIAADDHAAPQAALSGQAPDGSNLTADTSSSVKDARWGAGSKGADRFYLLDAMRGIAAIAVMQFHMNYLWNAAQSAPIAVDLFFALSGFVLANSYLGRLQTSNYLFKFMKARVIRLYPLYLLGLVASVAGLFYEHHLLSTDPQYQKTFAFNLFMMPAPKADLFFPFNPVSWSLFWEIVVNFLFGAFARLVRPKILFLIVGVCAVPMLARIALVGIGGWTWATADIGATRTLYSFGIGCLYYCLGLQRRKVNIAMALLSAGVVAAILYFPHLQGFSRFFTLFVIAIGNPFVLWLGVRYEFPSYFVPVAKFLGDISYPIYLVHIPLSYVLMPWLIATGLPPAACVMTFSVITIVTAWLLVGVDERVRRTLTKWSTPRISSVPKPQIPGNVA